MHCPYGFECSSRICFLDDTESKNKDEQPCVAKGWKIINQSIVTNNEAKPMKQFRILFQKIAVVNEVDCISGAGKFDLENVIFKRRRVG